MAETVAVSDLDAIREDITGFFREIAMEFYLQGSGQKDELKIAPIYERYGHLFSEDLAWNLKSKLDAAGSDDEKRTWKHLFNFAFFGLIGEKCKKIMEDMARKESGMKVSVRGDDISYHGIVPRLTNEPDRDIRRELDDRFAECELELNEFRREKWSITRDIFRKFGYSSYREGCRLTSGVDFDWLAGELKKFLDETEGDYVEKFDRLASERLGYPICEAGKCDLAYLMRGEDFDSYFPKAGMVEKCTEFLAKMNMPIGEINAINLDIEEREKKRPRAFCSSVEIAKEIYVVLRPSGGSGDYLTFLHELGHAYHFAHTDASLPSELTRIGDSATSEIFAFNFNYLPTDPSWLQAFLDIDEPNPFVEHQMLIKLYFLRRYASKFLYELELHRDYDMASRQGLYAEYLNKGLKASHRDEYWMFDLDDAYYSAGYLRAWIFEYQLREHLREKFGVEWWTSRDAAGLLKDMWKTGRMYMPEEISRKMLGTPLDLSPIKREVRGT